MRSQASSPVERYADYKTHCLHEIGWANAGVTTPIPLWVRNTGRRVDVPWFRWELSNRVPSSCPVRRIPRQDPLHTTGWESLTNGYTIIPKDKVKAESLLITEHISHTSMCINNASVWLGDYLAGRQCGSVLTHLPLEKMAAISRTIFSDAFSWMKSLIFWLKFYWSLFLTVQLIITQHWFR